MSRIEGQQAVWDQIVDTYDKAQSSGASSKFKTHVQILDGRRVPINFVLRVSESLRDKPKPPKSRWRLHERPFACRCLHK